MHKLLQISSINRIYCGSHLMLGFYYLKVLLLSPEPVDPHVHSFPSYTLNIKVHFYRRAKGLLRPVPYLTSSQRNEIKWLAGLLDHRHNRIRQKREFECIPNVLQQQQQYLRRILKDSSVLHLIKSGTKLRFFSHLSRVATSFLELSDRSGA